MLRPAGRGSLLLVDATASANIGHVRRNMHEFEPEPKLRRATGRTSRAPLGGFGGFSVDGRWHTAGRYLDYVA